LAKQQANTMNNSLIGKYKLLGCFIGKYSVVSFLKTVMNQWNVNISSGLTLEVHNHATKDPKSAASTNVLCTSVNKLHLI